MKQISFWLTTLHSGSSLARKQPTNNDMKNNRMIRSMFEPFFGALDSRFFLFLNRKRRRGLRDEKLRSNTQSMSITIEKETPNWLNQTFFWREMMQSRATSYSQPTRIEAIPRRIFCCLRCSFSLHAAARARATLCLLYCITTWQQPSQWYRPLCIDSSITCFGHVLDFLVSESTQNGKYSEN